MSIKAASLSNAGQIGAAAGRLSVALGGDLNNTGLFYSKTSSLYQLDGNLSNTRADILAETDLTIQGLSAARAASIKNVSGNIEAIAGDLTLKAGTISNERAGSSVLGETSKYASHHLGAGTTTTVVTTREIMTHGAVAAKLLAGGNLTIDAGTLNNRYSQVAANGNISLNADTVTNLGRDLIETVDTTAVTWHSRKDIVPDAFLWFV